MAEYKYKCSKCDHLYTEVRNEDEPQWFTKCNSCFDADYVEID